MSFNCTKKHSHLLIKLRQVKASTITFRSKMGDKCTKTSWFSSISRFLTLLFCGETSTKAGATSGPEASIVAASKHFSSAHKVKFNQLNLYKKRRNFQFYCIDIEMDQFNSPLMEESDPQYYLDIYTLKTMRILYHPEVRTLWNKSCSQLCVGFQK